MVIHDTLEEFRKYENQDEYAYYDAYLHEMLKRNKMKKIMETSRYEESKKLMHLIEELAEYYHDNGSEKNAGASESYYEYYTYSLNDDRFVRVEIDYNFDNEFKRCCIYTYNS